MWNENALTDGGPVDSSGHESNGVSLDGKATEEGHRIKKKTGPERMTRQGSFTSCAARRQACFAKVTLAEKSWLAPS